MTKKYPFLPAPGGILVLIAFFLSSAQVPVAHAQTTLFAAASIAPVLRVLTSQFTRETGKKVRISAAASSVLARQIAAGAPANIVVLANPDWMTWLQDRDLVIRESRRDLISNQLAILGHTESRMPVDPVIALKGAVKNGRIAMADPDHVPAGKYGKSALIALGIWNDVSPHLARSANAPAAVALLSRGEVEAAISYQTDARLSDKVRILAVLPDHLYPPIRYQIALISSDQGSSQIEKSKLITFLTHPDRLTVFTAAGFRPPYDGATDDQ
jgi:molybdate transport system substrate-binding protein